MDTHYPNYTKRLKETSLKNFLDLRLFEHDIHFFISTNRPQDFIDYQSEFVHIYDINELRKDYPVSIQNEILPIDPKGIYPSKFPWNIERFILKKVSDLGFNYVINLDSDVVMDTRLSGEEIRRQLDSNFEENVISTNQAIFQYEENSTNEIFHLHNLYKKHFNLNYPTSEYNSLDGPVVVYMGKSSEEIGNFFNVWNELTEFGYNKPTGFGYENIVCGNWSLTIPQINFKLKWKSFPFTPHHKFEDRY